MHEINRNPSRRDLLWFGVLLVVFVAVFGALVRWRPEALVGAAVLLGVAWLTGLVLNGERRVEQLLGALLPGLCIAAGGAVTMAGVPAARAAGVVWVLGGVVALAVLAAPVFARFVYVGWMLAAVPVGWTVTRLVLGVLYYLVVTPIGVAVRLAGRDPMQRTFDRASDTYWTPREPVTDPSRYFKQF